MEDPGASAAGIAAIHGALHRDRCLVAAPHRPPSRFSEPRVAAPLVCLLKMRSRCKFRREDFHLQILLKMGLCLYNIYIVYALEVARSAQKDIKRLDRPVRVRVIDAIALLVADPYRQGARQLDSGIFRYRVGQYRIIYNVDNDTVTVRIVRVRHRSVVYKEKK